MHSFRNRNQQPRESYFARALAEDTSHLDNYEVECGASRTEQRRRSSAARTRETLDQLIQVINEKEATADTLRERLKLYCLSYSYCCIMN